MNQHWTTTLATTVLALGVGCHSDVSQEAPSAALATEVPRAAIEPTPAAEQTPPVADAGTLTGTVVETMDSGGYTYVLVDTGNEEVWAAGPPVAATRGDKVTFDSSMPMTDYYSGTLERTFDLVYFTGSIELDVAPEEAGAERTAEADAGVSVEGVFANSADLVGTEIVIRGEVVKYNPQILGMNWLHIRDGTGAAGTNDLTVTTAATVAVGDNVLVRGVLAADRDFGAGYLYDLIVEDAEVTVE